MPTPQGCTLCGGNDHARSECSWSGATDEREAATEAAYAAVVDGGWSSVKEMGVKMFQAGVAWQRAQSAPAGAVPGGWRLVPVEPTPEMLQAGADEPLAGDHDDDAPEDYRAVFKAMLAAAPQPAPQHGDKVCQHIEEAAGILRNMIDSIATRGNYSQESTLLFLNQALGSIDAAISAQGEGART